MDRRSMMIAGAGLGMAAAAATTGLRAAGPAGQDPARRLARKYRFDDPDMDLFFMAALGWGPTGGLDIGQAHYVAAQIEDGNGDSWVASFADYGAMQDRQADEWLARGWKRSAGEARLKAFASYRSAWQFAGPGERFASLYASHKAAFAKAVAELGIAATFFQVPFGGSALPGVYLPHADPAAPLALVIGGADTCFEDLFLTIGRNLGSRGYAVALVDLPGQGITQASGLHWMAEAEKPIAAVIDQLVAAGRAQPGRIALIGLSLGGYFVARAAMTEKRVATVVASTPFPDPGALFRMSVQAAMKNAEAGRQPTAAALRSYAVTFWKAGASSPEDLVARTAAMVADPGQVTVPFLSILGAGDSAVFASQARAWHEGIRSTRKSFVLLDAASGADGHVQVNNRLRLAQESAGWMDEIFARG